MAKYSRSFRISEFASKDGEDEDARMCPEFMKSLQDLRDELGRPMIVSSGIRSPSHNIAVGGSKSSMHLSRPCKACDVTIRNWSADLKHRFLKLAFEHGFTGIGISKNFVHLDKRNKMALWTY